MDIDATLGSQHTKPGRLAASLAQPRASSCRANLGARRRSQTYLLAAGAKGVLVAGPSPHTRMVACSSLAPSKCTPLAKWVTELPAGMGTVAFASKVGPAPTHQVPETTMKCRSLG